MRKLAYKKQPPKIEYEVVFDDKEYSEMERSYLWSRLIQTLIKLEKESLQTT